MANAMKSEELESYRTVLMGLRSRLRGDLDQMTDEALRWKNESSGNLSNVPLHMADVGTENYDQEFTLGLIENEQTTLELVQSALNRIDAGTYGRCEECDETIAKPRLQALPYTRHCIGCAKAGEPWMTTDPDRVANASAATRVGPGRWLLFWGIALGGMAFDLATKSVIFARIGEPRSSGPVSVVPDILELRTSYNSGALWGLGRDMPHSSLFFAGLSIMAAVLICWYLFVHKAATDGRLTAALGLIMAGALGNCYDRLMLGHVRDFVHFHVDPIGFDCAIFNFADNMLVIGAVVLMLLALRPEPSPDRESDLAENQARPSSHGSVPVP